MASRREGSAYYLEIGIDALQSMMMQGIRAVLADASVSPDTDAVTVAGQQVARGSMVMLRPGVRRSDAQDMFLAGRRARVEAVLLDVEDTPYLAVSLADDPGADLRIAHGRFLYFAPDEVEPCDAP